jgi:two-component system, sensor histidine kinase and response regulator
MFGALKHRFVPKRPEDAAQSALAAARLKSEFLANISHEIRTPLNGVLGMTSLLLDTPLNEQQKDFARTAQASAESLLNLVNDILDFSKLEAGQLSFNEVEFNVVDAVQSAVRALADRAHRKGLSVSVRIDPDVPAELRGDPGRLRQVLLKIVGNAVKFTDSGEIGLTVSTHRETESHVGLSFAVRDTGIGIPEAVQSRLFTPFTQGDGSRTRKYAGAGLGLAISRQIVEMMGGSIAVQSAVGKGSTFTFTVMLGRATAHRRHRGVA